MRPKTAEEKQFIVQAAAYGIKAFTALEFDNNKILKEAFSSFIRSKDQVLRDDFSNILEMETDYLDFFQNYNDHYIDHKDAAAPDATSQLFELVVPVKEIICREYLETFTQGFVIVPAGDGSYEDDSIHKKVTHWHRIRREIDRIKPFVESHYPKWDKATTKKKREYKKSIEKFIEDLEILGSDTQGLRMVLLFLERYSGLNQIKKFKEDLLLEFKFPLIDTPIIAKKIVENSIL